MLLRVLPLTHVALGGIEGRVVSGADDSPIAGARVEIREIERSARTAVDAEAGSPTRGTGSPRCARTSGA